MHSLSNDTFGRTAEWNREGTLAIQIRNDTSAGQLYKAVVVLKNQKDAQDARAVDVTTSGVFIDWMRAEGDEEKVPSKVLSRLCSWKKDPQANPMSAGLHHTGQACGKGDAMPLKIYAPEFLVAAIEQSTEWPGATNELTVDLVANTDLSGSMLPNLTVPKMDGLHVDMEIAPFIAGDVRKGAICGEDPNTAKDLFVMFSVQNVRERLGVMDSENADHFVCVKVQYSYDNRTYREILTTERGRISPKVPAVPLNCSTNGTWYNSTNNQTINCTLYNLKLNPVSAKVSFNCSGNETGRSFEHFCFCSPGKNGTWLNTTSNTSLNCTPPAQVKAPWNQSVLTNTSEWFVSDTEWKYFNGQTWQTMASVPTDLLVANVSNGVRKMIPSDGQRKLNVIAGIAAGFIDTRSDTSFSRGGDKNVQISGDFVTPPRVAITSHHGSFQTVECSSSGGTSPWCSVSFSSIGRSAKISVEVLNIDFSSTSESVSIFAGGVNLGANLLRNNGLDNECSRWTKVIDGIAIPKAALSDFSKFDQSGRLDVNLTTTSSVGSERCSGKTLYAKITVETPAWDLCGPQPPPGRGPNNNQERVWNRWPINAKNPDGTISTCQYMYQEFLQPRRAPGGPIQPAGQRVCRLSQVLPLFVSRQARAQRQGLGVSASISLIQPLSR